jgi:hypothetical protein
MPRKLRKYKCIECDKEFESRQLNCKYCSKICQSINKGKSVWVEIESECIECGSKYTTKNSTEGKLQNQFCSKSCQSKYIFKTSGNGMNDEIKKKISDKLSGVSLKYRGYTDEAINAFVSAGQEASVKKCKGHILEEIVGEEKAAEMKKIYSDQRAGDRNPQSLKSISKRFNCSLDEARKLTNCYGRVGKKHPMFGKVLTREERLRCKPLTIKEGNVYSVVQGNFNNIRWQGSWELEFLINCYEAGIDVKRYDLPPVEYEWEDDIHRTWPDFIIHNAYIIEVKGYMNGKSRARIEACEKHFGDDFVIIDSVKKRKETSSLEWINKQKKIYGDMIEIINIPKNIKPGVEIYD